MRKLRRLPWRIPKAHHAQPSTQPADKCPRVMEDRESHRDRERERELQNTQPVAFAGGRYVYGGAPSSVPRNTEIRRKARHRLIAPFAPAT